VKLSKLRPLESACALKAMGRQNAHDLAHRSLGTLDGLEVWDWDSIPNNRLLTNKESIKKPTK
jgi:hypothetical protein